MKKVLTHDFFNRPTLTVAQELLGKFLVRSYRGKTESYMITEVEAYDGEKDLACHAHRGKTARNEVMFRHAGHIYVYFTYGMHWMLNLVTGPRDYPAAVLIRGVESASRQIVGPARLTKALHIDKKLNTKLLSQKSGLWVEDRGVRIPKRSIQKTSRIGVDRAGSVWAGKPYRFVVKK
ncbi:hypothetical protein A2841_03740 [Candidatus Kaiserbacteria bacterium RIFCSPHIGHO2_01_FULL_48_10]|uniref:Putative 3-methyladenine DNA glycosylase n=1 Tax=Candidatus Kaiserbacteria bacterium RIFCSPHIGHO2_01_FULL_48_10 TaxID=1798476 RepID=A0A1F6C1P5_9BACT|nr:MAG: hypothetical protein A2841_03740 [Candidatus Kaiserbacteria bacterium RIFCSPHIGHO2_01_FULL_48_10]